ncbi:MAG: hypothetical protein ACJA2S_004952 [Cyclobacteriaceae bacterium]|jgi:hypothetical protein
MRFSLLAFIVIFLSCSTVENKTNDPIQISGIYPHLAYYNEEAECGTGAVVPWADRLWVITYAPHLPHGSSDKLYEITSDLTQIVRGESIGGTPANRMIHRESNQLFIGPYAIDNKRNVKAISYADMQGRHTGNARHLFDPAGKIYYGTMEEGFYEVDVKTLKPNMLYEDGNNSKGRRVDHNPTDVNPKNATLSGAHGKGLYSGQGVMVYSNNGEASSLALKQFDIESGSLSEWDGENWKTVRRNQFVEVTGPGGIYGNANPASDPIWATGWDHKSVLLGVRDPKVGWNFYRLPKASHSYDGAHGWNTEWPRIRDIGTKENPDYLMTMHGMFWRFPGTFKSDNSAGIRPRSSYLKVIGDFARWNDQLVFGCDDSAQKEFLNKRKVKGNIEGPGQSNSNLWFTSFEQPDQLGPNTAGGAVWLNDKVIAGEKSEPFLFAGWDKRTAWIHNDGDQKIQLIFEVDKSGTNQWSSLKAESLEANSSKRIVFNSEEKGEWVRVTSDTDSKLTVHFSYTQLDARNARSDSMFKGITTIGEKEVIGGLMYGLGDNRRSLGISARKNGESSGYYELDADMNLVAKDDVKTQEFIDEKFAIPENVVIVDESSVLIVDDTGRRWRLPLGDSKFDELTNDAQVRICREVATERDLLNSHGTFYELPAENADGFAKIRPVTSHNFRIHDYASYRGMLVMTGIDPTKGKGNEHVVVSEDQKAAVWVGAIDDLWKMGKPTGKGGPWKNTEVNANESSDPYLIGFYDKKKLTLSHDSNEPVTFTIEVEPVGHGPWMKYSELTANAGESITHDFPDDFQGRWIRFKTNTDCKATAWLEYN